MNAMAQALAVRPLRRPAPPGHAPALRLPARDRRRPGVMGGSQGPHARLGHPEDGRPRRGPPDRLLRLRRRHPGTPVRGGDVIVWDWGTWEAEAPTLDGRKAIEDGELKFVLKGEKLRGRFTIVRTSGRRGAETGAAIRGRLSNGCSSTSAARVDGGLGRRGLPGERQERSHERRGQGQQGRDLDQPGARRRSRDRPVAGA